MKRLKISSKQLITCIVYDNQRV